MSLSHGMQSYIDQMENDTMASYPIEIQSSSSDVSTLMTTMMGMKKKTEEHKDSKNLSSSLCRGCIRIFIEFKEE